jgi:hypothetical protein
MTLPTAACTRGVFGAFPRNLADEAVIPKNDDSSSKRNAWTRNWQQEFPPAASLPSPPPYASARRPVQRSARRSALRSSRRLARRLAHQEKKPEQRGADAPCAHVMGPIQKPNNIPARCLAPTSFHQSSSTWA